MTIVTEDEKKGRKLRRQKHSKPKQVQTKAKRNQAGRQIITNKQVQAKEKQDVCTRPISEDKRRRGIPMNKILLIEFVRFHAE
jgi:hypothetical protein